MAAATEEEEEEEEEVTAAAAVAVGGSMLLKDPIEKKEESGQSPLLPLPFVSSHCLVVSLSPVGMNWRPFFLGILLLMTMLHMMVSFSTTTLYSRVAADDSSSESTHGVYTSHDHNHHVNHNERNDLGHWSLLASKGAPHFS